MHWGFLYQKEDDSVEKTADICGLDLKGYHGDQARENLTFRNPCKFKDCQFLVRFKRGLRLRIPLW